MRYLKKFNEDINSEEYRDLVEFCETHLANLLDSGYILRLKRMARSASQLSSEILFSLTKYDDNQFLWKDISDNMIPFLELLVEYYELELMTSRDTIKFIDKRGHIYYNADEILHNTIEKAPELTKIIFIIKSKR